MRLISQKEFYKTILETNQNKTKKINKYNLYDFNERLYYTWYKNKNIGDIRNYKKQTKLTEYIIYNRTKEKILDDTDKQSNYIKCIQTIEEVKRRIASNSNFDMSVDYFLLKIWEEMNE